jgi:outer membrane protein assembly factor BamB
MGRSYRRSPAAVAVLSACLSAAAAAQPYPQIEWWYDLDAPSFGSSSCGDLDLDGKLEIVFCTYFNDEKIHVLNAEDGTQLWEYGTGGCNDASSVIADVDSDDTLEVIAPASSPCMIYCLDGPDGSVEWAFDTVSPHCIDSPPALGDLDGDGSLEVVCGTFYGRVYAVNAEDGSQLWFADLDPTGHFEADPAILDVEGDGDLDVVITEWMGDQRVYALSGLTGSVLWLTDEPDNSMYHGCSFADLDQNGKSELVTGCYDSNVYCFNSWNGWLRWAAPVSAYAGAPTSLADLDNDGSIDILFAASSQIGALTGEGDPIWSFYAGGGCFRGSAIADVNSDGTLDAVFGADDGHLRALTGSSGAVVWDVDLQAHYGQTFDVDNAPIIEDFDGDGLLDVFVVGGFTDSGQPQNNHGRAYMLSAGIGAGSGWPMFRHDERHSGCFYGYATGIEEEPLRQPAGLGVFPNPSAGEPSLLLTLDEAGFVTVELFDLSGRRVSSCTPGLFPAGSSTFAAGCIPDELPPGCYICRVCAGSWTGCARLVILE